MNSYQKLNNLLKERKNYLCVGLDTDLNKIPAYFPKKIESMLEFNKMIINATKDTAIGYKINFAFYEEYGTKGFDLIEKTLEYIPDELFTIADAKRGDIGNTSRSYAKSVFETMNFDSITVSPYMGKDSIQPFLEFEEKLVFILCLTSNPGSNDFQTLIANGQPIYKHILNKSLTWGNVENIGYVVGATNPEQLKEIRDIAKDNVLLIPGIGTQGGSASEVIKANQNGPAIINSSRSIIYASNEDKFNRDASDKAEQLAVNLYYDY